MLRSTLTNWPRLRYRWQDELEEVRTCLVPGETGFEPLVSVATEMLIELARGITDANLDAGDRRHRAGVAVALTRKWDQRFESAFLQR
jgi:hypothetical protein